MKKAEIVVGQVYLAKVSGALQRVRVTRVFERWSTYGSPPMYRGQSCWEALNLATGRTITIKSAQRLRPVQ